MAALLVLLAACGGGGSGEGAHPKAQVVEHARRGGALRVGLQRPTSLDPAQARLPSDVLVADQLFDSLTSFDARTLEVEPAIARSWKGSADQRHWDFSLRPDARFSNGRPITSTDVKFSLDRIARKGSGSPEVLVSQLEPIAGFRAFNVEGRATGLSGVTAPSPGVVRIDLDQPLSSLPSALGHPGFGIVPREAVLAKAPSFAERPVGSGPFRIEDRTADAVHLVRAPGSHALLDGIDLTLADDVSVTYKAFQEGRLDWSVVPADRAGEAAPRGGRAVDAPYLAVLFYGFNLKNPKFADVRFRQAILHAIDRPDIAAKVYGKAARLVDGPVANGVLGSQPTPCGARCRHDPARAKSLLASAFKAGKVPQVKIDYDDDATQRDVAKEIQGDLRAVGIDAGLRPHPTQAYPQIVNRGEEELFRLGWIGVYPGPDSFLTPLFSSTSANNVIGFSSKPIDGLLRSARDQPDQDKRLALYRDAERRIMELVPIVPIAQFQTRVVLSAPVRNLRLGPLGSFDASAVWLASR